MILAQQNAGNIEVLRQAFEKISGLDQQVDDISGNMVNLTNQVNDLVQAQQDYLAQNLPAEPPEISGADEEEDPEEPDVETDNTSSLQS
jgi:hypothetical protein